MRLSIICFPSPFPCHNPRYVLLSFRLLSLSLRHSGWSNIYAIYIAPLFFSCISHLSASIMIGNEGMTQKLERCWTVVQIPVYMYVDKRRYMRWRQNLLCFLLTSANTSGWNDEPTLISVCLLAHLLLFLHETLVDVPCIMLWGKNRKHEEEWATHDEIQLL